MIVRDLSVRYGSFTAADQVNLSIPAGGILGLVGESGSGKSTVAKALVGLVPVASGSITGVEPGRRQLVFQDPYSSLDPRMTVGASVAEGCSVRGRQARADEVARLLALVSLDPTIAASYPRALSGGQRQRVAIARALGAQPKLLIADEITSALDVSVQGSVLNLVCELRRALGLSILFISHNLAVVRYVCDEIAVIQDGRVVELGDTEQVSSAPRHPHTQQLMAAVPSLGRRP
ncbi:MAG: ATP-binding cassette domain-containing protein [Actinomycetota bacterium]|nr:ATP-binding cassette domain-containing protein [Actinomycetota bacterium]